MFPFELTLVAFGSITSPTQAKSAYSNLDEKEHQGGKPVNENYKKDTVVSKIMSPQTEDGRAQISNKQ